MPSSMENFQFLNCIKKSFSISFLQTMHTGLFVSIFVKILLHTRNTQIWYSELLINTNKIDFKLLYLRRAHNFHSIFLSNSIQLRSKYIKMSEFFILIYLIIFTRILWDKDKLKFQSFFWIMTNLIYLIISD